ncbi:mandelate racemase/muconate lactonizing enzyme family protein [Thalassobaculum salexigens]|uniref:mandelate racemase/muconate lactonizing enzyme family protein n=1 Tax=Thalassobaculum salexigens TaxID=455360 RepID=UPI00248EB2D5|nr:mandelate racemase/muconate lactonizing enzyme family protein [Thalassobaculum salexigens]
MKVTGIETIRLDEFPNLLWVHVETDEGLKGLGETFYGAQSAEAHVHAIIAPYLLGQDPLQIERHHANMIGYVGFSGASAEQRGRSAVDIALWDLWGKASGQPIHQLLGGASRDDIRVYNTCAGYQYVRQRPVQGTRNFGIGGAEGPYEDLDAFLNNADELAHSLLEMGIDAMKIWPFDYAAEASQGHYISASDLKKGLEPFEKIRAAVGDRMDIMCELHSMWNRPSAVKIARALEEIEPTWVEDPVFMDHLGSLGEVARATTSPIAVGETRGGKADFRYLVELDALSVIIADLTWCGGLTEGRKISTLCDAWHVPVAFHDCTGPVALTASTHLALHARNCFIQEMVRAFYYGWYGELVTQLPPVEQGRIRAPQGPGLGLELLPDITKRPDAQVRRSTL